MSKKSIIKGTFILTVAGLSTKLLGFYNRIFLTSLIGVKELGIYQLIFPLYVLAFSISSQGIATTLTKQIAYHIGCRKNEKAKNIFMLGVSISFLISLLLAFVMNYYSKELSIYILKNSSCAPLLKILSIAVPFVAIKACLNAFFVGINKPAYQGISQFIEQVFRIGITYLLSVLLCLGKMDAKAAVIAVCSGEIIATFLSVFFYMTTRKKYFDASFFSGEKINKEVIRNFNKDAIPITANNVLLTAFSSFEAIILPSMLYCYYKNTNVSLEIFGIVTGVVMPFLFFPSTITSSLSTMLLPEISYANAKKDEKVISATLKNSMLFCLILGVLSWAVYGQFGESICYFSFKNKIAGKLLANMSYMCPLIFIAGNLSAILNGLDKTFKNLIYHVVSIIIRIIFTVLLVPIYGITAYIAGMTISYVILNLLMLYSVKPKKL